ncbi:MAG TPA: hypothetical protein PK453_28555 [Leptospiraceae bacterium]|nr:hypothetical protein [Leptospiraceae bacterium]
MSTMNTQEIMKLIEAGRSESEIAEYISKTDYEKASDQYPNLAAEIPDRILVSQLIARGYYVLPSRASEKFESLSEEEQTLIFTLMNRMEDGREFTASRRIDAESESKIKKRLGNVFPDLFNAGG